MSLLCIPIRVRNLPELKILIKEAEQEADVLEIWIDALRASSGDDKRTIRLQPSDIMRLSKKPLIIVNKRKNERGTFKGSEKARLEILGKFAEAGAAYIDVSIGTARPLLKRLIKIKSKKTKILLSYHDFKKTPSLKTLIRIRDKGFAIGADIVKIVTQANKMADNLEIFKLLGDSIKRNKRCIAFCMGKKGLVSRVLAPRHGSYIIYNALDAARRTAPGQLTVDEFKKISLLMNI